MQVRTADIPEGGGGSLGVAPPLVTQAACLVQPHPGTLNVKLGDTLDFESLLWTRSGAHGNLWHEAHCPVPAQITDFHVGKYSLKSLNNIKV